MRSEADRLCPLVKTTIILLAILTASFGSAISVSAQPKPATKDKPAETRKKVRKKAGLAESVSGTLEVGTNIRSVKGEHPGKFEENREVPKAFFIRKFDVHWATGDSPWVLNLKGLELGEQDERYSAEARMIGTFRTKVLWDEIPKYYSDGRTLHLSAGAGLLVVNPEVRARLQAIPDAAVTPGQLGPALGLQVRKEIQNSAAVILRLRSDQFLLMQSYHPNKNWEFFIRAQHLRLHGTRPKGTGTFQREGSGPLGDGVWESMGVELPEPVDYGTANLTVGFQYSRPKWRVGFEYNLSRFRDSVTSLTWENPFRVTDSLGVPPAFGIGRNRFVRAQLALPPANDYQSFTVHASVDLPHMTQLRGELTWGRGTQNQAFLPYTLNSAMITPNLPAGVPGLAGLATPQPSLNGVVHTLNQDYALASKPWKNMTFLVQFRSDKRDNQSPNIRFPAFPSFGDSGERIAVDLYGLPLENLPSSYTRKNATATWQWDPNKKLSMELGYNWEIWTRTFRDVPRTNEHSFNGELDYKLMRGVALKSDYLYSRRIAGTYLTQPLNFNPVIQGNTLGGWEATLATVFIRGIPLEFNQLRRFDEANRTRNDGGISLEITRSEKLNYSASYRYLRDDYDKRFYGLHYDVRSTLDAQVSYFPRDSMYFYANYSREQDQNGYRDLGHLINGATQDIRACCAQFPIANTWDRSSRIHLDMFQVGLNSASEGEKTVFDVSYVLASSRDRTRTVNPFTILPISLRTAGAVNYPDVINRQQEFNISITHKLRPYLDIGFSYLYEPYKLDDFYTNNLQQYTEKQLADGNLPVPTARQLFLDARFTNYRANVGSVFLRYTF